MSTIEERKSILDKLLTNEILSILLMDRTTGENIIWATNDYSTLSIDIRFDLPISIEYVDGTLGKFIIPRVQKAKETQTQRSRDKAEVFTPSWVCNAQNNLIDDAWFGKSKKRFNMEHEKSWETNYYPINFEFYHKKWQDYVSANRLEISCGEAPYLTSRYDTVTGKWIPVRNRIGLLDRKLRVISENVSDSREWIKYAKIAVQSVYGFEWQGDSLFLARKNILSSVIESYYEKYHKPLFDGTVKIIAEIITWNIIQMDGLKFVIPGTCHEEKGDPCLFEDENNMLPCPGCKENNKFKHNGIYAQIMDWDEKTVIKFVDLVKGEPR